jgi:quercetin dioxygenase-like cupin family protein
VQIRKALRVGKFKSKQQMKTINIITKSLLLGIILMLNTSLYAQDPTKVSSSIYKKVILENEKTRVIEVEYAPGVASAYHSHPAHVAYFLTGGKMEMTNKGEKTKVMDVKAGDAVYMPAVTHMGKNVGKTTIKLIIVEMKPQHSAMMKTTSNKMNEK